MKIRRLFVVVAAALCCCGSVSAQVGKWKNFLSYSDVKDVRQGGSTLYVLASNNLYSYNVNDNSVTTYDKVNGLNDCNISKIEWNKAQRKLLIVYSNYNIDILDANGNVTNVSDYLNASLSESKEVLSIYMNDRFAYLCTGFGIVKLDMRDAVISDTYNLHFRVDYCYIEGGYIYAASSTKGLYKASLSGNLLDPGQWSRVGNYTKKTYTADAELMALAKKNIPDGPKNNNICFIRFHNGRLYGISNNASGQGDIELLNANGEWGFRSGGDTETSKGNSGLKTVYCLDVDPKDENHVFAGAVNGLYEFRDGKFVKLYNDENSPITTADNFNNKDYEMVYSVKYDADGDLWIFNSQARNSLMKYDGNQWTTYNNSLFMTFNGSDGVLTKDGFSLATASNIMFDSRGLMWFCNNNWTFPSVYVYNPSTDQAICYSNFINEDGTKMYVNNGVRCLAEDMENNIWVGTNNGLLYIQSSDVGKSADELVFQQYKVPRNDGTDLADYLLNGLDITCMAIDGGNRKWFGTGGNGVYLISSDNNTEVHHFLSDNSPLLSDNIESIAIDPGSGEVFFATDNGLCSYKSDATATVDEMNKDVTYAYPNPVKPGYTGPITVTGLTFDADVKIVTSNGVLVAEGRSNGGSFVWDGTDLNGKRVASGVYMVQTATSTGDKGTVCKIVIVN